MRKIICDRCGKEMHKEFFIDKPDMPGLYDGDYIFDEMMVKVKTEESNDSWPFRAVDLCDNCRLAIVPMINKWMQDKRNEKG